MTDQETTDNAIRAESLLEHTLDRISLEQALRDFEIANLRVTDLTQRLISANNEIIGLRSELSAQTDQFETLTRRHDEMQGSTAFRLASKIWAVRNLLRG